MTPAATIDTAGRMDLLFDDCGLIVNEESGTNTHHLITGLGLELTQRFLMNPRVSRALLTGLVLFLSAMAASGQELTPRAYWPAPKGTQIVLIGYNYSTGDVVTDPSLPVIGVDSKIHLGLVGYLRTVNLFGRTANFLVELPYSGGETKGLLAGDDANREFSGIADMTVTVWVNLIGAPSMNVEEFQELRQNPHQILGGSLRLVIPTGDYDPQKLINVGANRWAIKGELGYMIPLRKKWLLEFDLGLWLIGDNDDFFGGVTRKQDPIVSAQAHLVKRIRPGFWGALDFNYYLGGRSTVGTELRADLQRNSRLGGTLAFPFRKRNLVKVSYSTGVVTESGGDYDMLLLSYSRVLK